MAIQKNCNHEWGEAVYDPEKKPETRWVEDYHIKTEYFYKEEPTGRMIVTPRWSHTCKLCDLTEYTYDFEEKGAVRVPRFKK